MCLQTTYTIIKLPPHRVSRVCVPKNEDSADNVGRHPFSVAHFLTCALIRIFTTRVLEAQMSSRHRWMNSQIPSWPLPQHIQGSNTSQGTLAATCRLLSLILDMMKVMMAHSAQPKHLVRSSTTNCEKSFGLAW